MRLHRKLPRRPWYEVDEAEVGLARQLVADRFGRAFRAHHELDGALSDLLVRLQAILQQEGRADELPAAVAGELERLGRMTVSELMGGSAEDFMPLYVTFDWKGELRRMADEYLTHVGTRDLPEEPPSR